jgi:thiamine monophosphate synthase
VVLGPVKRTPSHPEPQAVPLGWSRFAELVRATSLPVYAIGGLAHDDLDVAQESGAHGVALMRAAWPEVRVQSGQRLAGAG